MSVERITPYSRDGVHEAFAIEPMMNFYIALQTNPANPLISVILVQKMGRIAELA